MPTSLSWRQRGRLSTRPGGGRWLKTGGGKFLKNSAATGGMIQKNDNLRWWRGSNTRFAFQEAAPIEEDVLSARKRRRSRASAITPGGLDACGHIRCTASRRLS